MTPLALRSTLISIILLAAAAVPRAEAQRGWAEFGRRLDGFAGSNHLVGGSAILVREGAIVARHHYGFADRAGRRRVTDRTIYHWASVTKTLTAVATLQLRDRKRLSLDDRIVRWVPELRGIYDTAGGVEAISLRMLLSHTSGLQSPTWPWGRGESWEPFEPTTWNQLVAMMPYQRLEFRPGERFGYSNPGYIYLARAIEQLSGDPWAVYIQKNLWAPLGMNRSYVGATPYHLAADRSHGYRVEGDRATDLGADFDPGVTIPNSGWNAPLDDVARYIAFLAGAAADSVSRGVLSRTTREEMWKPVQRTGNSLPEFAEVGLGFFSMDVGGQRIVGHTGDQAGYRSYVYLDPQAKAGVVIVFNTTSDAPEFNAGMAKLAENAIEVMR